MIFYIFLFCSFFFAQNIYDKIDTTININLIDTSALNNSSYSSSLKIDSLLNGSQNNDIF